MAKFSPFSETIYKQKYAHSNGNNQKETWTQISKRVVNNVLSVVSVPKDIKKQIIQYIDELKFIPGGRYLYASGLPYHQTQNCFLFKAQDSREGWADLLQKSALALMTGGGIGTDYSLVREEGRPIRKIKGFATGPISLAKIINEAGRYIMQGGSRRSAIWAGLKWDHPDIYKFINSKNWIKEVRELKTKDFSFPADLDMTNISVLLNDEFFEAYHNDKHPLHSMASSVYWATVERMLKTSEPGFSIDCGSNKNETLRNACVTYDTRILTDKGYSKIGDLLNKEINIWNGIEFTKVRPSCTGLKDIFKIEFSDGTKLKCSDNHEFIDMYNNKIKLKDLKIGDFINKYKMPLIKNKRLIMKHHKDLDQIAYSQGFYSGDGFSDLTWSLIYEPKYVCINRLKGKIKKDKDRKRKRWLHGHMLPKDFVPLNEEIDYKLCWLAGLLDADGTINYSKNSQQAQISSINKKFLQETRLMLTTLEIVASITKMRNGGFAFLPDGKGGKKQYFQQNIYRLHIGHNDLLNLIELGLKTERINLSNVTHQVRSSSRFPKVIEIEKIGRDETYCFTDFKNGTGCFEGIITGQCTEITSSDDADVCNLGSINLGKIDSLQEMKDVVECASIFLLAGTIYSDVPFAKVDEVRNKNRRIGLGLMGMHEFLLRRNQPYGINEELGKYLKIYNANQKITNEWSKKWEISKPIKTRSIAPTGTIAIVAGTTTGIEPLFCSAYKRRYLKGKEWHYQYVIDNITEKIIEQYGLHPDDIEDAYSLSKEPWRRMDFQKWVQKYVDHAISSTMNIPTWGSVNNNKDTVRDWGNLFLKYLPDLRGMTIYADGSRGGQPLQPIKYETAKKHRGEVFRESNDLCEITGAGSCGT